MKKNTTVISKKLAPRAPQQELQASQKELKEELKRLCPKMLKIWQPKIGDLAQDLIQDAFIKAFIRIEKGEPIARDKIPAWFGTIIKNTNIDYFRRQKPTIPMSKSEKFNEYVKNKSAVSGGFDTLPQDNASFSKIWEYVRGVLPPEQFRVFEMRFLGDVPYEDIAEKEAIGVNTALGRYRLARLNLQKYPEIVKFLQADELPPSTPYDAGLTRRARAMSGNNKILPPENFSP